MLPIRILSPPHLTRIITPPALLRGPPLYPWPAKYRPNRRARAWQFWKFRPDELEEPGRDGQASADDADGELSVGPEAHQSKVIADITGLREAYRVVETQNGGDANAGRKVSHANLLRAVGERGGFEELTRVRWGRWRKCRVCASEAFGVSRWLVGVAAGLESLKWSWRCRRRCWLLLRYSNARW